MRRKQVLLTRVGGPEVVEHDVPEPGRVTVLVAGIGGG